MFACHSMLFVCFHYMTHCCVCMSLHVDCVYTLDDPPVFTESFMVSFDICTGLSPPDLRVRVDPLRNHSYWVVIVTVATVPVVL